MGIIPRVLVAELPKIISHWTWPVKFPVEMSMMSEHINSSSSGPLQPPLKKMKIDGEVLGILSSLAQPI